MFDRSLVPFDGSSLAERAIPYVVTLPRSTHGGISLLHVTPDVTSFVQREAELETAARLDVPADLLHAQGVKSGTRAVHGDAARHIVDVGGPAARIAILTRQEGVDLITMATRGRTGLARLTLGSVATTTLHQSHVPILISRPASLREQDEEGTIPARSV